MPRRDDRQGVRMGHPGCSGNRAPRWTASPCPESPTSPRAFRFCIRHAENAVAFEVDRDKAVREFRKHLGWYTKGIPEGRQLRQRLFQVVALGEVRAVLDEYLTRRGVLPVGALSYR